MADNSTTLPGLIRAVMKTFSVAAAQSRSRNLQQRVDGGRGDRNLSRRYAAARSSGVGCTSTSGLLVLDLPRHLRDVLVLADGDEAGREAANGAIVRGRRSFQRVS
jgi:hypothetical protein